MRILLALLTIVLAESATAQSRGRGPRLPARSCDRDSTGTGTIVGRIVADSGGVRLRRGVFASNCVTLADSAGRFAFRGLAPGDYEIGIANLGVRWVVPTKVSVTAGRTDTVTLQWRPEASALGVECLDVPSCATLLDPAAPDLGGDEALREVAYRTAIAITYRHRDSLEGRVYCLRGIASEADPVLVALKRRIETVRPQASCEQIDLNGRPSQQNIRERGTGRIAWSIGVGAQPPRILGEVATVHVSYSQGRLWGALWECRFVRDGGAWRPVQCIPTGAS